ncbi:RrF2 family transcriptional regulator [Aquibacillus saliphilus]|uniref:RrF2 family transcriptional regulator n=1 Tax=Aquibacillus saliphilus TaxID=1909422 RepID=UPI001CEFC4B0|nr:Rrf2 family transcriptional regulator [Aquibacillus saliphilus]
MRLKKYTDYALRVLILTGSKQSDQQTSIKEIADSFSISTEHVRKVVFQLNKLGFIKTTRGRNGGIRLAQDPREINVGNVVRLMENDFVLLECFDKDTNHCIITPSCKLKHALNKALQAFLQVLDDYTLEDLLANKEELRSLINLD